MQLFRIYFALALLAVMALEKASASDFSDAPLVITVSILPQVWLVERVGGEFVAVTAVVSPGESPATFQPSDVEVSRVLRSDVYFCLGMPFESGPWFEAIRQIGQVDLIDLREGLDLLPAGGAAVEKACSYLPGKDPHIWLSPKRLAKQAQAVASALISKDRENSNFYTANLRRLQEELSDLDIQLSKRLMAVAGRPFFVYHPTWGYFADDYGLRQVAVERHGSAPSDRELTALRREFASSGSLYLFVQPQIAGKSAASVAKLLGAELREIDPLSPDVISILRAFTTALEGAQR